MARFEITDDDVESVKAEFPEVSSSDVRRVLEGLDAQTVGVAIDWGWNETTVADELTRRFGQFRS